MSACVEVEDTSVQACSQPDGYTDNVDDADDSCFSNDYDCSGECTDTGSAYVDDCGVCDGENASMDNCGVCDGGNADGDDVMVMVAKTMMMMSAISKVMEQRMLIEMVCETDCYLHLFLQKPAE